MYSPEFIEEMKLSLLAYKKKLEEDLAGLQPHVEMGDDAEDNALEVQQDQVNNDVIVRINEDLEKIDKALAKIESGTYGFDDEDKPIGEERLRAIPWADKAI